MGKQAALLFWLFVASSIALSAKDNPADDLFKTPRVLHLKISITAKDLESLRREPRQFVPATVQDGTVKYEKVAIHLKGAAGSFRAVDDRPALTLDFNKFARKQKFHGLSKIHLNNSVQDPALLDEALCGELFREAGVPAARASHAVVFLNDRNLGLYVLKEGFSDEFIAQYFFHDEGNLYDAGFVKEIVDGPPKIAGKGPDDHSDLKKLLKTLEEKDPNKRWKKLNDALDVERFISMSVLEVFTVHWDGYGFMRNNYKLYVRPDDGKVIFLVHGMDQMFGRGGDIHQPLDPPLNAAVSQAVFSTDQGRQRYRQRLEELFNQLFLKDSLLKRIDRLAAPVRAELDAQKNALQEFDREVAGLKDRVTTRQKIIAQYLKKLPPNPR